ncbi:MAG: hypothetical protein K2J99_15430 [Lachnospiraceae bacterium]|nr:hypothetical protein [Lachnospiraceae bacterium]
MDTNLFICYNLHRSDSLQPFYQTGSWYVRVSTEERNTVRQEVIMQEFEPRQNLRLLLKCNLAHAPYKGKNKGSKIW